MNTWAAIITGIIGGLVYILASKVNLHLFKVGNLDTPPAPLHAGVGSVGSSHQ